MKIKVYSWSSVVMVMTEHLKQFSERGGAVMVAIWNLPLDPLSPALQHVEPLTKALSLFLHSWNRAGSVLLWEGLGCALHQHWWREDCWRSPCGVLKWLVEKPGPIWCGFVYSGPSKSHCFTFQVFHVSVLLLPPSGFSTPTICLLLRVTRLIGYQCTKHISSIWL